MAGDWMKIELELPDKPEVHAIAGILNIDSDSVVGKLVRVWQWFNKHTTDGNAHGVTFSLPDRISGVSGFGEAMQFVGWLEQHDKTLHMPKFERHTSESAKQRALTARRVNKHKVKSNDEGNDAGVTLALPREEKRREEKINTKSKASALATRLPADWEPSEKEIEFCKKERPELNPLIVAARFKDHWIAEGGAKGRKADWTATWRNWVRNERATQQKTTQDKSPPKDWT